MISDVLAEAKEKMHKAVEVAKDDFSGVRTGRANPALFQKLLVDYYGTPTPLGQLAGLHNSDARTLLITLGGGYDVHRVNAEQVAQRITEFFTS